MKYSIEQFLDFSYKNIIHEKIVLSDVSLLVQKDMMWAGYAEQVLNNYGLSYLRNIT